MTSGSRETKVYQTASAGRDFRPGLGLRTGGFGRMILPQLLEKQVVCLCCI